MQIIELEDRKIYRAKKGKKVRFVNSNKLYSEIVVMNEETNKKVEEVE